MLYCIISYCTVPYSIPFYNPPPPRDHGLLVISLVISKKLSSYGCGDKNMFLSKNPPSPLLGVSCVTVSEHSNTSIAFCISARPEKKDGH